MSQSQIDVDSQDGSQETLALDDERAFKDGFVVKNDDDGNQVMCEEEEVAKDDGRGSWAPRRGS